MIGRILVGFLICIPALLGWEVVYSRAYKGRQVPLGIGFSLFIFEAIFFISSFELGMWASHTIFPGTRGTPKMVANGSCALAALWTAHVLIQPLQNAVRRLLGQPTRPIRWVRRHR
jgi:hypothetical protein